MINANSKKCVDDLILPLIKSIEYIFDNTYTVEFANKPLRLKCLLYIGIGYLSILLSS